MNKPRRYMAAHWVGGSPHSRDSTVWLSNYALTEGEIFERMTKAADINVYSRLNSALVAICTTDDIIERLMAK